jgi:hypothetical protein
VESEGNECSSHKSGNRVDKIKKVPKINSFGRIF